MRPAQVIAPLRKILREPRARRDAAIFTAVVLFFALLIPGAAWMKRAEQDRTRLEKARTAFSVLEEEYRAIARRDQVRAKRRGAAKPAGVIQTVESLTAEIGVRGKMKSLRGIPGRELEGGLTEDSAEIRLEKLTMNELVHLLYRIETGAAGLTVRRANLRRAFDRPDRIDLTLTLSVFTPPQRPR